MAPSHILTPILPQPIYYGDIVSRGKTVPDTLNFRSSEYPRSGLRNWPAPSPCAAGDIWEDGSRVVSVEPTCDPKADWDKPRWFWRIDVVRVADTSAT